MTVRVGLVGCGLVAQAMHLYHLAQLRERFTLVAAADPSETVRSAVKARYGVPKVFARYEDLLALSELDAVLVCTPPATHADIVLAALARGLHVFVEKPLCVTLADADKIIDAAHSARTVVQVGYMKRFDPAFERMLDELPDSAEALRYVAVTVRDPDASPFFDPDVIVRGTDVPAKIVKALEHAREEQVEAAIGTRAPSAVFAFLDAYLDSLIHDVNLVHGLLERMGEPLPARVVAASWWAEGRAVTGSVVLADGGRWDSTWIQLPALRAYSEVVTLFFEDSLRSLDFPSPWLKQSPTRYEYRGPGPHGAIVRAAESYEESFKRELSHFQDCIVDGIPCRTPPEQARLDIAVLTEMFVDAQNNLADGQPRHTSKAHVLRSAARTSST